MKLLERHRERREQRKAEAIAGAEKLNAEARLRQHELDKPYIAEIGQFAGKLILATNPGPVLHAEDKKQYYELADRIVENTPGLKRLGISAQVPSFRPGQSEFMTVTRSLGNLLSERGKNVYDHNQGIGMDNYVTQDGLDLNHLSTTLRHNESYGKLDGFEPSEVGHVVVVSALGIDRAGLDYSKALGGRAYALEGINDDCYFVWSQIYEPYPALG